MKYRKKPIVVEAIRWTRGNTNEVLEFAKVALAKPYAYIWAETGERFIDLNTLEGKFAAMEGDWIIKGVAGEFYPCKNEIFEATYEVAEGE